MRAWAGARGADFAVFLLPDEYQFDAELRAEVARRGGPTEDALDLRLVQSRLTPELAASGVGVIDPFDRFAADHRPGRYFIAFDTHFDEEGNRVAAEVLAGPVRALLRAQKGD